MEIMAILPSDDREGKSMNFLLFGAEPPNSDKTESLALKARLLVVFIL